MPFTAAARSLLGTAGPAAATRAFVTNQNDNSVTALNISNTASMTFVSELTDATNLLGAGDCALDKTKNILWVCAAGGTRVAAVNVANPASMSVSGHIDDATYFTSPVAVKVDPANSIAWVLEGTGNPYLACINTSNPASPTRTGSVSLTGSGSYIGAALAIDTSAQRAYCMVYVAGGFSAVRIISVNISNPASPTVLDTLDLTTATDIAGGLELSSDGTTLFASYHGTGYLAVINVSDASNITLSYTYTGFTNLIGGKKLTYVSSSRLVVSSQTSDSLKTFNISNLASITLIDTESGATYLDKSINHAVDPFNNNVFVLGYDGDDFSSYSIDGSGNLTFISNYTSGTNINGPFAVALK